MRVAGGVATSGGGLFVTGASSTLVLCGRVRVERNNASATGGGVSLGAGARCEALDDTRLSLNTAGASGGGAYASGGALFITDRVLVDANVAPTTGAGLHLVEGASALISASAAVVNSTSDVGGCVAASASSFRMLGLTTLSNCSALTAGGGISATGSNVALLNRSRVTGCTAKTGGGVYATTDSTLRLGDQSLLGHCEATESGAGAYLTTDSALRVGGDSRIVRNLCAGSCTGGGGVSMASSSSAVVSGRAVIEYNRVATGGGAGLKLVGSSLITADDASVSWNTAESVDNGNGAGVYAEASSTVTTNDRTSISNNVAKSRGGGVYLDASDGTCTDHTSIDTNEAVFGGGVYLAAGCTFTLTSSAEPFASITNNKVEKMGGGAYIIESYFNVLGGEISDNEAASTGGAFSTAFLAVLNVNGMRADRNKAGESWRSDDDRHDRDRQELLRRQLLAQRSAPRRHRVRDGRRVDPSTPPNSNETRRARVGASTSTPTPGLASEFNCVPALESEAQARRPSRRSSRTSSFATTRTSTAPPSPTAGLFLSTTPTSSTSSAQCLVTTRPRITAAPGAWLALDSSSPSLARSLTQTLQPSSLAAISSRRRRASPIRHSSATLRPREVRSTFIPLRI